MAQAVFVLVSPFVAKKMGLYCTRLKMPDGNVLLYQSDLLVFGPLFRVREYAARIGGTVLNDPEAAAVSRGESSPALPVPTDPEYIDPEPAPEVVDERSDEGADENTNESESADNVDTDDEAGEGESE